MPAALAAFQAIDPDALSPREALDQLYAWWTRHEASQIPLLVMPTHRHTLLDQTYRAVIERQRHYGR